MNNRIRAIETSAISKNKKDVLDAIATYFRDLGYTVIRKDNEEDLYDKSSNPSMYINIHRPDVSNKISVSNVEFPTTISKDNGIRIINDGASPTVFDNNEKESYRLLKIIEELKLENLELKTEVEYLEKYVEYLETNYSFILKDSKLAKEIFNARTKGGSHE